MEMARVIQWMRMGVCAAKTGATSECDQMEALSMK